MLVHHLPFLPLFCEDVRPPPVDLVRFSHTGGSARASPAELHAPIERRHRRSAAHGHVRLLHVVRQLRRSLQVVFKRFAQRPQPANPLVLRGRKPHEPAIKQFQRAPHVAPVDRPHLFPFQMQNLPAHALRHRSPPISSPARRSCLSRLPAPTWSGPRPCRGSGRDADTTPALHCSSVVDGPNPPRSFASGVFPVCPDHVGCSCRGGEPPFLPAEKRETQLSQGRKKRLPKGSPTLSVQTAERDGPVKRVLADRLAATCSKSGVHKKIRRSPHATTPNRSR